MGVDRYRVSELYAAGPDGEASGSGYRFGDQPGQHEGQARQHPSRAAAGAFGPQTWDAHRVIPVWPRE
jgi:hypothetical protein